MAEDIDEFCENVMEKFSKVKHSSQFFFLCIIRGKGGKISSLLFPSFLYIYVVELSFLVSKSAHLPPNSRWFRFFGRLKVGRRSKN